MKNLIHNRVFKLLKEEYENSGLHGYHVTTVKSAEKIADEGFKVGHRSMQGQGVYAFYNYDEAIRYAMKGATHTEAGDRLAIVRFRITNPYSLIILDSKIAKQVFGGEASLRNQVNRKFWVGYGDGLEGFLQMARAAYKPDITMEELVSILGEIETNNSELIQRKFALSLMPKDMSDNLNLLWQGQYGVEYRVNHPKLLYPESVFKYNEDEHEWYNVEYSKSRGVEDAEIKKMIDDSNLTLPQLMKKIEDKQMTVRNNQEFERLGDLISKIEKELF